MPFLALCDRDPLVTLLHDIFGANIVRVPDSRVQPLTVISHCEGRTLFRGALEPLLVGEEPLELETSISEVASISGRHSRRVGLDLGLYLLKGFLSGLGIAPMGVEAAFQGVQALTFSFPRVRRNAVDINILGRVLTGRAIERSNPAAAVFFDEPSGELLVIDSVLSSGSIAVSLAAGRRQELALDVDLLQQLIADSGGRASVAVIEGGVVTFSSDRELTFAFSCVRMFIDEQGAITALPPDLRRRTLGPKGERTPRIRYSPDRVLLSGGPGLLTWD